jgi:hypothetical protein
MVFNFGFKIEHSLAVNFSIEGGVARCPLFHKFGKNAGFVSSFPFSRNMAENTFAHGAAFPVGNHFAFVGINIFLWNGVSLLVAGVEHMKIIHTVASQLWESGNRFWPRSAFANNQFIIAPI